ncbi:MAG: hypothetical protein Q7R95_10535, partial [bacterium]|nr:hypothetical protein [bacterium]
IKDYKKNDTNYLGSFTSITYGNLEEKLTEILPKLRHESGNCPVCILAAIRQAKIPVYLMKDFDFKKECEEIFKQRNADMEDERSYY